jgi:hypothetical protein
MKEIRVATVMAKHCRCPKLGAIVLLALTLASTSFCVDRPKKMIHVVVQMRGTNISIGSFAAKPKVYWRASTQYCRVDEEPDLENKIHGRMIANEPDIWVSNLADKTAKHILDAGPAYACHLPIFAIDPELAKSEIAKLEIGHEVEFFRINGAKLIEGPKLTFPSECYKLVMEDVELTLVERTEDHAPVFIGLTRGPKSYKVSYLLWNDQLPFKSSLFSKPSDVRIQELR